MNDCKSDVQNVIDEIEAEQSADKISAVRVFRSLINQPDFVAINSTDRVEQESSTAFDKFTINLPRPILEAESIQLVSATVPTATANIPDTACVFWYYRLSSYRGVLPSVHNLHFVRLLPSYYKIDLLEDGGNTIQGTNKTFEDYASLGVELEKSCQRDWGNSAWQAEETTIPEKVIVGSQYRPYDIKLSFNASINKFQMVGLNTYIAPAYKLWLSSTKYNTGDKVIHPYRGIPTSFVSIKDNNLGITPDIDGEWVMDNGEIISPFVSGTPYTIDRIVQYTNELYICVQDTSVENPNNTLFWSTIPLNFIWYKYLITGYKDENVKLLQDRLRTPWSADYLFEMNDVVEHKNVYYSALRQTNAEPDSSIQNWNPISVPIVSCSSQGQTITIKCDPSSFVSLAINTKVYISKTSNTFFNEYPKDTFITNVNFYTFQSASQLLQQVVLFNDINFSADTPSLTSIGGLLSIVIPKDIGLSALSGQNDYIVLGFNVPSQPFNPNPKRILNSILGFTWNGVFNNSEFGVDFTLNKNIDVKLSDVLFLNRIRPNPNIKFIPSITLQDLGSPFLKITSSFTADGYCNLVYSSTVQIYASVVQGSTLNTTTSTGLLGSVMLNAKNLGVAFFQEGFSAPLSIFGSDIYSLQIQLKDDMNEPYSLTNNCVMVMVLKITYK